MERPVTVEAVNAAVRSAAAGPLQGIVEYEEDPVVSSDVIGNPHSSVFDALSTMVLGGDLLKAVAWYDNGWGYARRVVDLIERFARLEAGR
jgi:glyceraldehyde 3-phosphate dehydrogenase